MMVHPAREVGIHQTWGDFIEADIEDWRGIINARSR